MSEKRYSRGAQWNLNRRRFIHTVGAGATVGGVGSVAAQDDDGEADGNGDGTPDDESDATGVHPVFGFPAASADVEPPVEPDHEISLEMRIEEGRLYPEFFFEPTGLYVEPGETVQFTLASADHTVTGYHETLGRSQRVPENVGPISSPLLWDGAYFLYTFDEPGVYDLYCAPHEFLGMVVRVVAGEATGPGAEPVPEPDFGMTEPPGAEESDPDVEAEDGESVQDDEADDDGVNDIGEDDDSANEEDTDIGEDDDSADEEDTDIGADDDPADEEDTDIGENEDDDGAVDGDDEPDDERLEQEPQSPQGIAALVLADPTLGPDEIIERGRVGWDDLEPESRAFPDEIPVGEEPADDEADNDEPADDEADSDEPADEEPEGEQPDGGTPESEAPDEEDPEDDEY